MKIEGRNAKLIIEVSFKKGEKPYMRDRIGGKVNAQTTGKWTRQVI